MNMQGKDPKKEEIVKRRHFTFRLNVFFFCIFVLFSILIVRLAILQFVEGEALSAQKEQQMTASVPIPPVRGNIYDRNGYPIAQSLPTQSLYFRMEPGQNPDEVIALAKRLETVFKQYGKKTVNEEGEPEPKTLTAAEIVNLMDTGYDIDKKEKVIIGYAFSPRRIKSDLSKEEIAYFTEHRDELKYIEIVEESIREYSNEKNEAGEENHIAVQLIGYLREYQGVQGEYKVKPAEGETYLGSETVGYDGIEYMYQNELRGRNGLKTYPVNASGKIIPGPVTITPPVKGNNLYLTIDKDVQLATEKAIEEHLEVLKTDPLYLQVNDTGTKATTGYAVAMEVETGKVVAMVSYPDYDPDLWRGGRISTENLKSIELIYGNGTIKQNWAPYPDDKERSRHPGSLVYLGSTMKPLTVLLGLNEGLMTPNEKYQDTGKFEFGVDGSSIRNSDGRGYGPLNAEDALYRSANTYMAAMIGERLYQKYGRNEVIDVWDKYMKEFGLGVLTGSGLPQEIPGVLSYPKTEVTGSALASMVFASFGQGAQYTTLQLAQYAGVLASEGKRMRPQFVERIETPEGELVQGFTPELLNEVDIPKEYWDVVERGMIRVVKQGFEGVDYTVASKTGTSEQDVAGGRVENAVFIAYAPVEKPKLAVAVVVPEGGYGSWGAAPIARQIFDAYDQAVGLTDAGPKAPASTATPSPDPSEEPTDDTPLTPNP